MPAKKNALSQYLGAQPSLSTRKPSAMVKRPAGGTSLSQVPRSIEPTLASPNRGCRPGIGKHGKKCAHGVNRDGFCCQAPVRVDTTYIIRKPVADTVIHVNRGTGLKGVSPPTVNPVATAAGAGVAIGVGKAIVGYLAANKMLELTGKGIRFVIRKTPIGRLGSAAGVVYNLYQGRKQLNRAQAVKLITKGLF